LPEYQPFFDSRRYHSLSPNDEFLPTVSRLLIKTALTNPGFKLLPPNSSQLAKRFCQGRSDIGSELIYMTSLRISAKQVVLRWRPALRQTGGLYAQVCQYLLNHQWVFDAMTFMLPQQTRQVSMLISNTRFKRCTQLIAA
jgi:hypothetical protein